MKSRRASSSVEVDRPQSPRAHRTRDAVAVDQDSSIEDSVITAGSGKSDVSGSASHRGAYQ